MGDVPPSGFGGFGWGSALVLPWHEHVWGQLDVLVVFGEGEEGAATRVALWQGQSHIRILRLRRSKCTYINTHTYIKLV